MDVRTVHDQDQTRRIIDIGAVSYEFAIVDREHEDDVDDGYEYLGDGDAPDEAIDALEEWISQQSFGDDG